jgi:hypothetical protein
VRYFWAAARCGRWALRGQIFDHTSMEDLEVEYLDISIDDTFGKRALRT